MADGAAETSFKGYHEKCLTALDAAVLKHFAKLSSNEGRVAYALTLPRCGRVPYAGGRACKDATLALQFKNDGNAAFQKGDWPRALRLYNQSCLFAPHDQSVELSIIVANRSACLYHLGDMRRCLAEVARCLAMGYPARLRYKVLERRARCQLEMHDNQLAMDTFKEMIASLADTDLSLEKRDKITRDAELMTKLLVNGRQFTQTALNEPPAESRPRKQKARTPPRVTGNPNPAYPAGCDAFTVAQDECQGRFARATRDIQTSSTIIVEPAHCSVLLEEYSKTHCQHCFKNNAIYRTLSFVPCSGCPNVVFCSEKCRDEAMRTYHRHECGILPKIWQSQTSITCHMALRMITQREVGYFERIKPELGKKFTGAYESDDYRNVYNLVDHESKRNNKDLFERTHMAVFLLKLLMETTYFDRQSSDTEAKAQTVEYIGGLILKNLQVLQFNTHEIFELKYVTPDPYDGKEPKKHLGKTVFVGGGLYPTLALFNHSCDPDITRYFNGTSVVVRTIKKIREGKQISENYGPLFTRNITKERRDKLIQQYWFVCHCLPCEQNWPTYEGMAENSIRFRCTTATSKGPCNSILKVDDACDSFMMKCIMCRQHTNIMKGLLDIKKTDALVMEAYKLMDQCKYKEAMAKFIEVMNMYDDNLVPPYRSYSECQQSLRMCMLTFGNHSK